MFLRRAETQLAEYFSGFNDAQNKLASIAVARNDSDLPASEKKYAVRPVVRLPNVRAFAVISRLSERAVARNALGGQTGQNLEIVMVGQRRNIILRHI